MNHLRLSLLALFTGAVSGGGIALIMGLIGRVSDQLWGAPVEEALALSMPLPWSLTICGSFGLALSLLHRNRPHSLLPELVETLEELRDPDVAPKRDNKRALVGATIAQIGGGSIGPEALMSRLAALISQRIWHGRDHAMQSAAVAGSLGLFGAPLLGGAVVSHRRVDLLERWLPGTLGGLAGFVLFHGLIEVSGGSLQRLPYTWPTTIGESIGTISAGLLAGLMGCGLGVLLLWWRQWLIDKRLMNRWPWWPLLTGLLLGALMHWLPLVPFAGEEQLRPLLEDQNSSATAVLLLSGLVKLIMLGLCLETGWRGGIFFPLFLVACTIGLAFHQLLPDVGSLGSWCGGLTGALYRMVLPSPLVVLVLGVALLQGHGSGGLLVGLALAHLIRTHLPRGDGPPPLPQTPDSL